MLLTFKAACSVATVVLILAASASHSWAVSLWKYDFNHFSVPVDPPYGENDWENQANAMGSYIFTNPNEGWTVQGSSNTSRSRGNVIANPYGPGNIIESVWPTTGTGGHLKAWHGYATGGSGNVVGGIQPYITDMATADLVKYTFDVQTGNYVSGNGNRIQWEVGAYTAPGNRGANAVFGLGYYDPFLSSTFSASGAVNWRLVTPAGTVNSTTKPFYHLEHLLVDVLVDLNLGTASVSFDGVADPSLQNISLGAVDPRLADEIYFDSHGGQVISLQVETLSFAVVPEPEAFSLAGLGLACLVLVALRKARQPYHGPLSVA